MKRLFALALCGLLLCSSAAAAETPPIPKEPDWITTPYVFPYQPETPAWIALETYENRLTACQIPADLLPRLTTPALLETIYDYPFGTGVGAFNSAHDAYLMLKRNFNAIDELIARPDCFAVVCAHYRALNVNLDEDIDGRAFLAMQFLELLMTEQDFLSGLTVTQVMQLTALQHEKYLQKLNYPDVYALQLFLSENPSATEWPHRYKPAPALRDLRHIDPSCTGRVLAWIVQEGFGVVPNLNPAIGIRDNG